MLAIGSFASEQGLALHDAESSGRTRTVDVAAPTFVATSPYGLLVTSERARGAISLVATSTASVIDAATIDGGPCHVGYHSSADVVATTNYGNGTVTVVDASPSSLEVIRTIVIPHRGGPREDRQEASHPHQSVTLRGSVLLVTDLGSDTIWAVDVATGGVEEWLRMPPGSGPRHMAWSGDQLLVVGELDSTLYRIDARSSTPSLASSASTRRLARSGLSEPSHLLVVEDSAYVLNRGPDELVRMSASGDLGRMESVSTGGVWPRHFALVGTHFLVANQRGGGITRVPRDREGRLGAAEPVLPDMVEPAVVVRC